MMTYHGFIEYLKNEKKFSVHTIKAYQKDLWSFNQFLSNDCVNLSLLEIDHQQVRSWIVELSRNNHTNKSINRKLSTLKSFYKFLVQTKQIKSTPLQKIKSLKTPKYLSTPFSIEEVQELIVNFVVHDFETARDKLIIEMLYATGMRRAELINLKLADVDTEKMQIRITGKRNKQRVVPLYKHICNSIYNYMTYRKENQFSNIHFFITKKDKKLYPSKIYKVVKNNFTNYSNKHKKSPHILRHTYATHLLNNGATLNEIKDLLGHESLSSTEIYTKNSIEQLKKSYQNSHPRETK